MFDTGLRLSGRSIYIALTFEFGHNTTLLKKAIFDKVYNIEIEPPLVCNVDLDQAWSILPALELLSPSWSRRRKNVVCGVNSWGKQLKCVQNGSDLIYILIYMHHDF